MHIYFFLFIHFCLSFIYLYFSNTRVSQNPITECRFTIQLRSEKFT